MNSETVKVSFRQQLRISLSAALSSYSSLDTGLFPSLGSHVTLGVLNAVRCTLDYQLCTTARQVFFSSEWMSASLFSHNRKLRNRIGHAVRIPYLRSLSRARKLKFKRRAKNVPMAHGMGGCL